MKGKKGKSFAFPEQMNKRFESVVASAEENVGTNTYYPISLNDIIIEGNPRRLALTPADIINGIAKEDPLAEQKEKERLELSEGLATSIKQQGVLQAVHVYKHGSSYILIIGQRRVLASLIAGKKTIVARIWDKKPDEIELKTIQWIENFNRKGLKVWEAVESAKEIANLYKSKYNDEISVTKLADYLFCSKPQALKYHSLMQAKSDVWEAVKQETVTSLRKAYELNKIEDKAKRVELIDLLSQGKMTEGQLIKISNESENQNKIKVERVQQSKGQGRNASKIHLGFTPHAQVAKEIFLAVLDKPGFKGLRKEFDDVNWHDYKSINKAFKKLIDSMENMLSE